MKKVSYKAHAVELVSEKLRSGGWVARATVVIEEGKRIKRMGHLKCALGRSPEPARASSHPAKTVADCFKYRNKVGLDVALEALRDYRRKHRAGMDELWYFANTCRVARVMQPYLEALL